MTELILPGCRSTPLGSYLAALGLLRTVTRLLDDQARGHWERQHFALTSRFSTIDELTEELLARFEPESIVSPWNEGAGFVRKGANKTAAEAVEAIRTSTDPRLARLSARPRRSHPSWWRRARPPSGGR